MARRFSQTNVLDIAFVGFFWMFASMLGLFFVIYYTLIFMGQNPSWGLERASNSCMSINWIELHRDTLVETVVRAAGFVAGSFI